MRKKLLIASLVITSLVFAQGFNDKDKDGQKGKGQGMEMSMQNESNLTDAQKKELQALLEKHQKEIAPLRLNTEEKNIAIKKELLADKINWGKVEGLIKEKSAIEGQIEVVMLKNRAELQEKFGNIFGFGMGNMNKSGFKGQETGPNQGNNMKKNDMQEKGFGNGLNKENNMKKGTETDKTAGLSEAQQKDLKIIQDKYKKQIDNLRLSEQEKDLAIQKEMIADKINWSKVESLAKEKSVIDGQLEMLVLQERAEIREKLGENFDFMPDFGMVGKGKIGFEKGKM